MEEKAYVSANLRATDAPVPGPTPAMIARALLVGAILREEVVKWAWRCARRVFGSTETAGEDLARRVWRSGSM
jgi:hypothetical protein